MRLYERAGKWYVDLHYFDENGNKKRKKVCTKIAVGEGREREQSEQKARLVASRIEGAYAVGKDITASQTTLEKCLRLLILDLSRKKRSAATIAIAEQKIVHLCRLFNPHRPIEDIRSESLHKYVDVRLSEKICKCEKECEHKTTNRHTIHRELRTLRQAWKVAKTLEKVQSDPPAMPDLGKYYDPKERVLTRKEAKELIFAVSAPWTEHIIMYLHTGCSATELERIRGDGCNFKTDMVHIPGTKADERDRWIPMTNETRPILKRRRDERGKGLLFDTWTYRTSEITRACKRADIPGCSPNDFRRTYATEMANAGVPILVLQKLMGHSSGRMLEKVYAKIDNRAKKEAVKTLPSYTKRDSK